MDIIRIDQPSDRWDRFVWETSGGTIFSTLRFLSYHPRSKFNFLNLAAEDGGQLVAAMAGGDVERGRQRFFRSPVGASFGGFLLRRGCDLKTVLDVVRGMTSMIESLNYAGIELVCAPSCYYESEDQGLRFALGQLGYGLASQDATMVVDLNAVEDDDLDPVLRRNLRKAERSGVIVHSGTALEDFYGVLVENLAAKGTKPTHTLQELEQLVALFPDRLITLEATVEGQVVGGCLLVICNSRVGLAFYICDDRRHSQLRVAEAALFAAAGLLRRMGIRYFDLGTVSAGYEINWGLVRFKSKFCPATYVREHFLLSFGGKTS